MKNQRSSAASRGNHTGNSPNAMRRVVVSSLYESGMSIREIASIVGTTFQAVHSLLRRMGVQMRSRGGSTGRHSRHKR
jgi:transposase